MKQNKKSLEIFKFVSTMAIILIAISPATFRIPSMYQIWIFLVAVLWLILCTTGAIWS